MPLVDTRNDGKINEAEVFYYNFSAHNTDEKLSKICNLASQALQVNNLNGNKINNT